MTTGAGFVEQLYGFLAAGDVDSVVALYGADAEIVRYDGIAATPGDIGAYWRAYLRRHPGFSLRLVDQLREADDILMWDALVDTDNGVLQTVHVVMFSDDGSIRRHIPGVRGYWSR